MGHIFVIVGAVFDDPVICDMVDGLADMGQKNMYDMSYI